MADLVSSRSALSEVDKVQNPAFGASLLWFFGRAYQENEIGRAPNLLQHFLVLPICLHKQSLTYVLSTKQSSGLGRFCEKLGKEREEAFALHHRCLRLRKLTFMSIVFGIKAGLFFVDYERGTLISLDVAKPSLAERVVPYAKAATKLGIWFGGMDHVRIFKALKVEP